MYYDISFLNNEKVESSNISTRNSIKQINHPDVFNYRNKSGRRQCDSLSTSFNLHNSDNLSSWIFSNLPTSKVRRRIPVPSCATKDLRLLDKSAVFYTAASYLCSILCLSFWF